jgi:hypothetical protein
MKGGKWLTEEEREAIMDALRQVRNDYGERSKVVLSIAILGRDDEPEYCTCGHAHGMHNADIWACDDCGKPVKEER